MCAVGAVAALLARDREGAEDRQGSHVEVAQVETDLGLLADPASAPTCS